MNTGSCITPSRCNANATAVVPAAAAAVASPLEVSQKKGTAKKTSASRPPMVRTNPITTVLPQLKSARTSEPALGTVDDVLPVMESADDIVDAKVHEVVLAFLRKTDVNRLYSREKKLIVDLSDLVMNVVAERDQARRELKDLREYIEHSGLSTMMLNDFDEAKNDDDVDLLEEKPAPTMWQLIEAGYVDDQELATIWNGLRDDPAFADLHNPEDVAVDSHLRAHFRDLNLE